VKTLTPAHAAAYGAFLLAFMHIHLRLPIGGGASVGVPPLVLLLAILVAAAGVMMWGIWTLATRSGMVLAYAIGASS
jgi:hypothetical protein